MSHGMEYPALARWGQPPPPGCAPSCSPVKINPVLAKPGQLDMVAQAQHIGRCVDCGPGHAGIQKECRSV